MGKAKGTSRNEDHSDDEMDVQQNNQHNLKTKQTAPFLSQQKKKKIAKIKNHSVSTHQNDSHKLSKNKNANNLIKQVSKLVNAKHKKQTLAQKQQIFSRVVKGLKGKDASKKQRLKSRIMLKRQLQQALRGQDKNKLNSSLDNSAMEAQKQIVHKAKKQPMNQKQEVLKVRKVMGSSLSQLKNLISAQQHT